MAIKFQYIYREDMVTLRRTMGRQEWTSTVPWSAVPDRVRKYLFDQHEYREFVGGVEQVWSH